MVKLEKSIFHDIVESLRGRKVKACNGSHNCTSHTISREEIIDDSNP